MHIAVEALDRATGRVIASLPDVNLPDEAGRSPFTLGRSVKALFTRAGLLSTAQAACAMFVPRAASAGLRTRRRSGGGGRL